MPRILIADDSSTMRKIIRGALKNAGHEDVLEAANGKEAVAASEDPLIKLILMDWNMPEMSGLEAVVAIRASGKKVPIMMVTTEAEKRRVLEAIKAGINDYVIKPFTPDALMEKVNKHLVQA